MENHISIYLDESGDLGWSLTKPYRAGGSSQHLTISAIVIPVKKELVIGRCIKDIYIAHKWDPKKEKK